MTSRLPIWAVAFFAAVGVHAAGFAGFKLTSQTPEPVPEEKEHEIILMPLGSLEGSLKPSGEPEPAVQKPEPRPAPPPKPRPKPVAPPPPPVQQNIIPEQIVPEAPPAETTIPEANSATTMTSVTPPSSEAEQTGKPTKPGASSSSDRGPAGPPAFGVPNGVEQSQASYAGLLQAWFLKYKRYPQQARSRRQEGVVRVWFRVDTDGNILEHRIDQSSGYTVLDKATLHLLKAASPVPAPPADLENTDLTFTVPISYSIH
jgi:protein TonB